MRFTAYDVYEVKKDSMHVLNLSSQILFEKLNQYPKIIENDESSYAPLYIHNYRQYVLGTLAQSYYKVLTKFDEKEDTKEEIELEDTTINDKTYFYLNCEESRIFIQGRRYPATLNKKLTIDRLQDIIGDCLGKSILFVQAKIKYTIDEIEEIFSSSYVKRIAFTNLEGLKLPEGAVLHNPKKYLDDAMIESYNTYSAPTLDTMELKAKNGEKLSKNPLAKIGMVLSKENRYKKVFKSMDIMDDGEKVEIKPDGNEHKVVYVPKNDQEDSYVTYDRILKKSSREYQGRFLE